MAIEIINVGPETFESAKITGLTAQTVTLKKTGALAPRICIASQNEAGVSRPIYRTLSDDGVKAFRALLRYLKIDAGSRAGETPAQRFERLRRALTGLQITVSVQQQAKADPDSGERVSLPPHVDIVFSDPEAEAAAAATLL